MRLMTPIFGPRGLRAALFGAVLAVSAALAAAAGTREAPPKGAAPTLPAAPAAGSRSRIRPQTLNHGMFRDVRVYRPHGNVKQFVLFLSGDGGWNHGTDGMAQVLAAAGAMVAGIDDRALVSALEREGGSCVFPDGDLENLAHFIQAYYHVPTYLTPLLGGYSAGASLAYAVGAQAPPGIFAGVLTLGFSPDLDLRKPLCEGENVHFNRGADHAMLHLLPRPLGLSWVNLTGTADTVCPPGPAQEFAAAVPTARMVLLPGVGHDFAHPSRWHRPLAAALVTLAPGPIASLPAPPRTLADLPLVEVMPPEADAIRSADRFAVLLSGDGGWAGIDKEVARAIAARGIPVAGLDSLRYFWSPRTPQGLARDLDRIIRYYAAHWGLLNVLLIGYSQGADVLPFAVNRLPPATRSHVLLTALIGLGRTASFEFHVVNWIETGTGLPVRPETDALSGKSTLCIYGKDDDDSICPELGRAHARVVELPGGHHFGGDYDGLAQLILQQAGAGTSSTSPASGRVSRRLELGVVAEDSLLVEREPAR